jgi:hypothetical protein
MNGQIQLIQLTPNQLQDAIIEGVTKQLEELKKHFQPKEPTELLTRVETANLLKVNLTTLWNYTKQDKLVSYGMGNRVYYKRSEVLNAIIQLKN